MSGLLDQLEFLVNWGPACQHGGRAVGVAANDGQQVREVMGYPGGQLPDGFHLMGLVQLLLQGGPLFFDLRTLDDSAQPSSDRFDEFSLFLCERLFVRLGPAREVANLHSSDRLTACDDIAGETLWGLLEVRGTVTLLLELDACAGELRTRPGSGDQRGSPV